MNKTITCESVNIGHPDKTCDFIADAILDEALAQDPQAQMAVECAIKDDLLMIYGEATTTANIDYIGIASQALKDIGYDKPFRILQQISKQSADINEAIVKEELRAGDQGMMYGYATNETPEMLPLPLVIAHALMRKYESWRKGRADFFADAKSQVSVKYDKDNKPFAIKTVLVSVSHAEHLDRGEIRNLICENVISPILSLYAHLLVEYTELIVNPSGKFTIWGSYGDSGCVGRKICVDTYGGVGKVGGGCFSSKSPQKVDRSAAYYCRFIAKNIVANGFADRCEVGVSYGIGIAEPLSISIDTFGTEKCSKLGTLQDYVNSNFDFTPANIIKELDLKRAIYKDTACYGHFGRDEFPWEAIKNEDTNIPDSGAESSELQPKKRAKAGGRRVREAESIN